MAAAKTAAYKRIRDEDGIRYRFYCMLSGALACTTEPIIAETPEEELIKAWETVGRRCFNLCQKCGKWVIDAAYNVDVFECIDCAPYETEPNYCKSCGVKTDKGLKKCPSCGHKLVYEGVAGENDE